MPETRSPIAEYVIVGSGITGAVIARTLADAGRSVVVVERRRHVGGNVHDQIHHSGIPFHTYGPHYFRTNSEELWRYVNRFASFRPFVPIVNSLVDGRLESWPVTGKYIRSTVGETWNPEANTAPANFEEACLAMMPRVVYEKFVRGYTAKQWGVPPPQLAANLARRFDVREDDWPGLMRHKYQGLPERGYTHFIRRILAGVRVILECDYLRRRSEFVAQKKVVFTGPIDEYFSFDIGRLRYRGQERAHEFLPSTPRYQPVVQVNHPDVAAGPHIRTIEWKHMMPEEEAAKITGTLLTRETTVTPSDPNDYEYPFPDEANAALYRRYAQRARSERGLLACGRLGEYRYYDMDQAIARARALAARLLDGHAPE